MLTPRRRTILVVGVTALIVLWAAMRTIQLGGHFIEDEKGVHAQIQLFAEGRLELYKAPGREHPFSAMFPGFHAVMAAAVKLTGQDSLLAVRGNCLAISLGLALTAYLLARRIVGADLAPLRAAQAYLMPLLFPFHFLVYTDVFSLLACLTALLAFEKQKPLLGGAIASLSLLIRQTNVVFLAFLIAYSYIDSHGWKFSAALVGDHLKRCWTALIGVVGLTLFVVWHGRVGLDDPRNQPLTFSTGNLLFSLVCCGLVFLPLHIANLRAVVGLVPWAVCRRGAIVLLVLAVVLACVWFYEPSHYWNAMPGFLRNRGLSLLTASPMMRGVFGLVVAGTLLSLAVTPLAKPAAICLYPFWFFRLAPVLLVEPRYYIEALVLLVLLRAPGRPAQELALWGWFVCLAVAIHYGVTERMFLP